MMPLTYRQMQRTLNAHVSDLPDGNGVQRPQEVRNQRPQIFHSVRRCVEHDHRKPTGGHILVELQIAIDSDQAPEAALAH